MGLAEAAGPGSQDSEGLSTNGELNEDKKFPTSLLAHPLALSLALYM